MTTYHILFNRLSRSNTGEFEAHMLDEIMNGENLKYWNLSDIENYQEFFSSLSPDDKVIVAGGDGTLNIFINNISGCEIKNELLFFPAGSGNDFARDIGKQKHCKPFDIKKYIEDLPTAYVAGQKRRFFNSISLGIDAQVCVEAEKLKREGKKNVNYAIIAIKCILTKYKFCDAVVTDGDGNKHNFKNVLLAITTKGRFIGGGVKVSPTQDRNDPNHEMTFIIAHNLPAFKAMIVFASIVLGKHFHFTKNVTVLKGNEFTVEFSKPTPIQIDGDTFLNQTKYHACAHETADIN